MRMVLCAIRGTPYTIRPRSRVRSSGAEGEFPVPGRRISRPGDAGRGGPLRPENSIAPGARKVNALGCPFVAIFSSPCPSVSSPIRDHPWLSSRLLLSSAPWASPPRPPSPAIMYGVPRILLSQPPQGAAELRGASVAPCGGLGGGGLGDRQSPGSASLHRGLHSATPFGRSGQTIGSAIGRSSVEEAESGHDGLNGRVGPECLARCPFGPLRPPDGGSPRGGGARPALGGRLLSQAAGRATPRPGHRDV
jgi:hypothetical protein